MGNTFFRFFLRYRLKHSTKKVWLVINYVGLYEKNAFRFTFGPYEELQPETHKKESALFLLRALPEDQN